MARRKKMDSGNILEIELEDGSLSYGVIIKNPLLAFSSLTFNRRPEITSEIFKNVAFQLWVMNSAIGKNGWPIVGSISVDELSINKPTFYRYDMISKNFYHYVDCVDDIPSTKEGCIGLECAAAWEKNHIEDRLMAFKKGIECEWEKSLRAENKA
jgi:immunity protein 26 of polymorphic toxin system